MVSTSKDDIARKYGRAIELSDRRMLNYRRTRQLYIQQYVGPYYGHVWETAPHVMHHSKPLNTIFSMVSILVPHLLINDPASRAIAKRLELAEAAHLLEAYQTGLYERLRLGQTLRMVLLDSMFGAGIIKTALGATPEQERFASQHSLLDDPGAPFVARVDLDDYILDASCRDRMEAGFEGNRYRVSRRLALESGLFKGSEDFIGRLPRVGADQNDSDPTANLSHTGGHTLEEASELDDLVELADIYLPREKVVLTLPGYRDSTSRVLAEREWYGDGMGPYDMLGYYWVPDNPLPAAPVGYIVDLDEVINALAVKAARQADRSKSFVAVEDDVTDGMAIRNVGDGQVVSVRSTDRIKEMTIGGSDPSLHKDIGFFAEWESRLGGNTDLLGGMATQSQTLGQDQMLMGSANQRITDMRLQVHGLLRSVAKKLAWYVWNDPGLQATVMMQLPGGVSLEDELTPDRMEGEFDEYSFEMVAYSKPPESPQEEYASLVRTMHEVIMPLLPIAAQQGVEVDAASLMEKACRAAGIDGFAHFIRPVMPAAMPAVEGMPGGQAQAVEQEAPQKASAMPMPELVEQEMS